jgi:hypothetical protein
LKLLFYLLIFFSIFSILIFLIGENKSFLNFVKHFTLPRHRFSHCPPPTAAGGLRHRLRPKSQQSHFHRQHPPAADRSPHKSGPTSGRASMAIFGKYIKKFIN